MSSSEARVVGIALGLIVGLILVLWLVALLWPAFQGTGMRGMAVIGTNLTGMLVTAAGGRWATEKVFASVDYSLIVAPYTATAAFVFFTTGYVLCMLLVIRMLRKPRPA
jgi:hypothetical protein